MKIAHSYPFIDDLPIYFFLIVYVATYAMWIYQRVMGFSQR
jgi:hypothetical protein